MNFAPHEFESQRLAALAKYRILDSAAERSFDQICALATQTCGTTMAIISLLDAHRAWFKAKIGLTLTEVNRNESICYETIRRNITYVIEDTDLDPVYHDHPVAKGRQGFHFYAGVPIRSREGLPLGTLCVADHIGHKFSAEKKKYLEMLAHQVEILLELRRKNIEMEESASELDLAKVTLAETRDAMDMTLSELRQSVENANRLTRSRASASIDGIKLSHFFNMDFPGLFYIIDQRGCLMGWNERLEKVTGYSHKEVQHRPATDFFQTEELKNFVREKIQVVFELGSADFEANLLTKSGIKIPYYMTGARIEIRGKPYMSGMGLDISATYRSEEAFQLRNRAMQASINAILITDLNGAVEYTNPAFEKLTGYSADEMLGKNCRILQGDDALQGELENLRNAINFRTEGGAIVRNYRKSGEMFWNDVQIAPVRNHAGVVTHFVAVLNDVTQSKQYEGQLEQQINFDPLTRLANRNLLKDRIRQAIKHAQRHKQIVTVCFVDLDNFKIINDLQGHDVGDQVLCTVADRLRACIRTQDTVARYGGDEFAFVMTEQASDENIAASMRRILKAISQPFLVGTTKISVSCSIGISVYPRDGYDVDVLLRHADGAMYRAKESGRNSFNFYNDRPPKKDAIRSSMVERLRHALAHDEFKLEYLPRVRAGDGVIVGADACLSWAPPVGGFVNVGEWISSAGEPGLVIPISEWLMHHACADIRKLQDSCGATIAVSFKICGAQFATGSLRRLVNHAVAATGIDASSLELVFPEDLLMQNPAESVNILHELKQYGSLLTVNNFGVGYSSLMYLQQFHLDRLKIDASLISGIGSDPESGIIARSIISLGHSLELKVVAEGVCCDAQIAFLRKNGCDEMEGAGVGSSIPFEQLYLLVKRNASLLTN